MSCSNIFLGTTQKAREARAKMNYWDFIKIRSLCTTKETVNKNQNTTDRMEKIFANNVSDKGLVSKIYKELSKLNTQRTNNPMKKWEEGVPGLLSKLKPLLSVQVMISGSWD